ncbi:MAG: AroM family protein [Alphaproteobacteria bacterium]
MSTLTIGIATIGQAPRDDIKALFAAHAASGAKLVLRGCLDGLTDAEIEARRPLSGADTLYTRLRGDHDTTISKAHVVERAADTLQRLRDDGCDVVVFACTGDFPPVPGDAGVLFPSRVLNGVASALLPKGRLGLLVPLPEQAEKLKAKWVRPGLDIVVEALKPSATDAETEAAALRLAALQPDIVAMDCMGYSPETKAIVKAATGVPTILAITATGRVMAEMIS